MELAAVSRTALGTARRRAQESARPDRLFDDPYAGLFARADPVQGLGTPPEPGSVRELLSLHVVLRTRFYDDHLTAACAAGTRQVVILASGFDARAYRLPWPDGVRLFELDLPAVQEAKAAVLAEAGAEPVCERAAVGVDLREDWTVPLLAAGLDPGRPVAWLAEGLLVYLDEAAAEALFTRVDVLSAPGSSIAFESGRDDPAAFAREHGDAAMRRVAGMWKGGLGARTDPWLAGHGWRTERHELAAVAAACGRTPPARTVGAFVTAVRLA